VAPGDAIALVDEVAVMPLFVAITPGMDISFEGAREVDGGGEGGPKRSTARECSRTGDISSST
jgi:hypothetical protein